jgi:hypothetical protein
MTREEVLKHFGTAYNMYKLTKIPFQNEQLWRKYGYIPLTMQLRLEHATCGILKADKEDPKAKK